MKKKLIITILFFLLIYIFFPSWTQERIGKEDGIYQLKQEEINGIEFEVMIRGDSVENPVILWISGEDDFSEICYISKYQEALEEAFTVVRYDKTGTGKSISLKNGQQEVTIDGMVQEVLDVTDYVRTLLQTEQVILVAQGYTTAFAIRAAKMAPEKYSAYVGVSQYTSLYKMQEKMLAYCLEEAIKQGQEQDIMDLALLQEKVQKHEENLPVYYVNRYIQGEENSKIKKDYIFGLLLQPEYNIADAIMVAFAGKSLYELIFDEMCQRDVTEEVTSLSIPCLFARGKDDHIAAEDLCQEYLDRLESPYKEMKVFEASGEYPYRQEEIRFALWLQSSYEKAQKESNK